MYYQTQIKQENNIVEMMHIWESQFFSQFSIIVSTLGNLFMVRSNLTPKSEIICYLKTYTSKGGVIAIVFSKLMASSFKNLLSLQSVRMFRVYILTSLCYIWCVFCFSHKYLFFLFLFDSLSTNSKTNTVYLCQIFK